MGRMVSSSQSDDRRRDTGQAPKSPQTLWSQLIRRRELIGMLVTRNLKIRYKSSALGFFWSLLVPLFLIVIYTVFLRVLRFSADLRLLVTGIIAWQFTALCLGDGVQAIVGNANLVTKSAFPRCILPLSMTLANFVNFLLSGIVLIGYLLWVGADMSQAYWLPLFLAAHVGLALGVALILATANVFFRDTEHLISMIMLAWFFMTPVIYSHEMVLDNADFPPLVKALFFVNPMAGVVTGYRIALLSIESPGWPFLLLSLCVSGMVLGAGILMFQHFEGRFGDEL